MERSATSNKTYLKLFNAVTLGAESCDFVDLFFFFMSYLWLLWKCQLISISMLRSVDTWLQRDDQCTAPWWRPCVVLQ